MAFLITETTSEDPVVLVVSKSSVLQERTAAFLEKKNLQVEQVDPTAFSSSHLSNTLSYLEKKTFYKIVLFYDGKENELWQDVIKALKKRKEQFVCVASILSGIRANTRVFQAWQEAFQAQCDFFLHLQERVPRANLILLENVIDEKNEAFAFFPYLVSGQKEELYDPEIKLSFFSSTVVTDLLGSVLITPGKGKRILFHGQKKESAGLVSKLQKSFLEKRGSSFKVISTPVELVPFPFETQNKIVREEVNVLPAIVSFLENQPVDLPTLDIPQPSQEVAEDVPVYEIHTSPEESVDPVLPVRRAYVVPHSIPYIENRLKKYEKRKKQAVAQKKADQYLSPFAQRVGQSRGGVSTSSHQDQTVKLDQELQRIFGSERVERKVERVKSKIKHTITQEKKNKRRRVFMWLLSLVFALGILGSSLAGLFILNRHLLLQNLVVLTRLDQTLSAEEMTKHATELGTLAETLSFQVESYRFILGKNALNESELLINASKEAAQARQLFDGVHQTASTATLQFLGKKEGSVFDSLEDLSGKTQEMYKNLSLLQGYINSIQPESQTNGEIDSLKQFLSSLQERRKVLATGEQLHQILPTFLAEEKRKTYAVLLQNNQELRPTGGFIHAVALVTIEHGQLIDYQVFESSYADSLLSGEVRPPRELQTYLGQTKWFLRDANWSPHFPQTAQQTQLFLEKSLGRKVDGVFAMNLYVLRDLVKTLGPVNLTEYGEIISEKNLFERVEFHSEISLVPNEKKDYLSLLFSKVLDQIEVLPEEKTLPILSVLYTNLRDGQMFIQTNDLSEEQVFSNLGWGGELASPQCPPQLSKENCVVDTIMQVETNIGVNKANHYLNREITHTVQISPTEIQHERLVRFANTATSNAWPTGPYKSFIRFYVSGSSLLDRIEINGQQVPVQSIANGVEAGKRYFGTSFEVPIQKEVVVKIVYHQTHSHPQGFAYAFFDQKQAGTGSDPLTIVIQPSAELRPSIVAPQAEFVNSTIQFKAKRDNHTFVGVSFY